jgi:hypothetical protein
MLTVSHYFIKETQIYNSKLTSNTFPVTAVLFLGGEAIASPALIGEGVL